MNTSTWNKLVHKYTHKSRAGTTSACKDISCWFLATHKQLQLVPAKTQSPKFHHKFVSPEFGGFLCYRKHYKHTWRPPKHIDKLQFKPYTSAASRRGCAQVNYWTNLLRRHSLTRRLLVWLRRHFLSYTFTEKYMQPGILQDRYSMCWLSSLGLDWFWGNGMRLCVGEREKRERELHDMS